MTAVGAIEPPHVVADPRSDQVWVPVLGSTALLLATCVVGGPVKLVAVPLWLLSMVVLGFVNMGAAFGMYIMAVALYGTLSATGLGTPFERPDNYALFIVLGMLLFHRARNFKVDGLRTATLIFGCFLAYGFVHMTAMGVMAFWRASWFMRSFGFPLIFFLLLGTSALRLRDLRGLVACLVCLAIHTSIVSFLERLSMHHLIFPSWIVDPTLNNWLGGGRSGGLFMQPQWNGTVLALSVGLFALAARFRLFRSNSALLLALAFALPAIFLTLTRAVWLGMLVMIALFLLWSGRSWATTWFARTAVGMAGVLVLVTMLTLPSARTSERLGTTTTVFYRFNMWNAGVMMAKARPIRGWGFAEFATSSATFESGMTRFSGGAGDVEHGAAVHQMFLSVLIAMGLPGLILFTLALWQVGWRPRRSLAAMWGFEGTVWLVAFFGYFFVQMQLVNTQEPTSNYLFYGTLGILWGLAEAQPRVMRRQYVPAAATIRPRAAPRPVA